MRENDIVFQVTLLVSRNILISKCAQCGNYIQKFTLTLFWQKFRETNAFNIEITKELI